MLLRESDLFLLGSVPWLNPLFELAFTLCMCVSGRDALLSLPVLPQCHFLSSLCRLCLSAEERASPDYIKTLINRAIVYSSCRPVFPGRSRPFCLRWTAGICCCSRWRGRAVTMLLCLTSTSTTSFPALHRSVRTQDASSRRWCTFTGLLPFNLKMVLILRCISINIQWAFAFILTSWYIEFMSFFALPVHLATICFLSWLIY